MSNPQSVGIDFGTTKTLATRWDEHSQRPVPIRLGRGTDEMPTIVHVDTRGNYTFGEDAEDQRVREPAGYFRRIKRELERPVTRRLPTGHLLTSTGLIARFLENVRLRVENEALHGPVGHTVLTVPALYGPAARANLHTAASNAGFSDFVLLEEPSAGGFAFLHDFPTSIQKGNFAIFDWGGGTLDLTILQSPDGKELMVNPDLIGGDPNLGGEDIDDLMEAVVSNNLKSLKLAPLDQQPDEYRIPALRTIRTGKQLLSRKPSQIFWFTLQEAKASPLKLEWLRQDLECLIEAKVESAVRELTKLLAKSESLGVKVNGVLLVGGTSEIPMVERCIKDATKLEVYRYDNCQTAVGLGAMLFAKSSAPSIPAPPQPAPPSEQPLEPSIPGPPVLKGDPTEMLNWHYQRLVGFFGQIGVKEIETFMKGGRAVSDSTCVSVVEASRRAMENRNTRAEFEGYLNEFIETMDSVTTHNIECVENRFYHAAYCLKYLRDAVRECYPDRAVADTSNLPQLVPRTNSDFGSTTPPSKLGDIAETLEKAGAVAYGIYRLFFR